MLCVSDAFPFTLPDTLIAYGGNPVMGGITLSKRGGGATETVNLKMKILSIYDSHTEVDLTVQVIMQNFVLLKKAQVIKNDILEALRFNCFYCTFCLALITNERNVENNN